jgi:hypothetical protein
MPRGRVFWEQALVGLAVPARVYWLYLLKFALYIAGWGLCCTFNALTDPHAPWYFQPEAFKKFVLFSILFEGLGLGCSSGPLSTFIGVWFTPHRYFLTPGTMKLPFIEGLPVFGSYRRSWFDVALYITNNLLLLRALVAPRVDAIEHVVPVLVVATLIGLSDRTQFLSMRPEQYLYMMVCFLSADWIAGAKWVQFAIWMGAGISKLNHIFPYVTLALAATHPFLGRSPEVKQRFMRSPSDLRPSIVCKRITHLATLVEISFPIVLLLSHGGPATSVALVVMTLFHLNIMTSMPPAVPIEWNIFVLYSMYFLFGQHAADSAAVASPALTSFLIVTLIGLPVIGNVWPARTSFLIAMRYYAGNWAYSSWMFRGQEAYAKLGEIQVGVRPFKLAKARMLPWPHLTKPLNAGSLHLLGRGLLLLWPKAAGGYEHVDKYIAIFGDGMARRLLGWSFGDGHLHDERLLRAVQARCQFKPGELVHIFVESQPLLHQAVQYRITDAASGQVEIGELSIARLRTLQPIWSDETAPREPPRGMSYVESSAE